MTEPRPPTRDQSLNHPCRIRNVPLNMNRSMSPRSSKGARISSSTVGAKSTLPCNLAFSNTYYKTNLAIVQVSWHSRKNWLALPISSSSILKSLMRKILGCSVQSVNSAFLSVTLQAPSVVAAFLSVTLHVLSVGSAFLSVTLHTQSVDYALLSVTLQILSVGSSFLSISVANAAK